MDQSQLFEDLSVSQNVDLNRPEDIKRLQIHTIPEEESSRMAELTVPEAPNPMLSPSESQGNPMNGTYNELPGTENEQENVGFQQVETELTELQNRTLTPPSEEKPHLAPISPLDLHKQVLKTSPREKSSNLYQLQEQPQVPFFKFTLSQSVVDASLSEIYFFYAKQAMVKGKQHTFDQLMQSTNTMTLQKYMFFCRDFKLIDLEINDQFLNSFGAIKSKRKINKLYLHKQNLILNKFLLVEQFKRCSTLQELTLKEFQTLLSKLAQIMFPVEQSQDLLYEFMEIKNKGYRKKMVLVGKAFNCKDQSDTITQEMLLARRIVLPPRPRAISVKQETITPVEIPPPKKKEPKLKTVENLLKWEDLNQVSKEFDPKDLLLEQDISDKEDEIYLNEYQLPKSVNQSAEIISSIKERNLETIKQPPSPSVAGKIRPPPSPSPLNKYSDKRSNPKKADEIKSEMQSQVRKVEQQQKQREKLIYETFMRNQNTRELKSKMK